MVDELRWEWTLPSGEPVAATLDAALSTESVWLSGRLIARVPRGQRPSGHDVSLLPRGGAATSSPTVPAARVIVTFDPQHAICVLRVGREEIVPERWPVPARAQSTAKKSFFASRAGLWRAVAATAAALALGVLAVGAWQVAPRVLGRDVFGGRRDEALMSGVYRAENGLFIAHFPASFAARSPISPSGTSVLVLDDTAQAAAIVVVATLALDMPRDPWALHIRAHREALAAVPRGAGVYEEVTRTEGTCLGERGAVVVGRSASGSATGANHTLWSCAFFHDSGAYVAMLSTPEKASEAENLRVREVLEATELTHLESVNRAPR